MNIKLFASHLNIWKLPCLLCRLYHNIYNMWVETIWRTNITIIPQRKLKTCSFRGFWKGEAFTCEVCIRHRFWCAFYRTQGSHRGWRSASGPFGSQRQNEIQPIVPRPVNNEFKPSSITVIKNLLYRMPPCLRCFIGLVVSHLFLVSAQEPASAKAKGKSKAKAKPVPEADGKQEPPPAE